MKHSNIFHTVLQTYSMAEIECLSVKISRAQYFRDHIFPIHTGYKEKVTMVRQRKKEENFSSCKSGSRQSAYFEYS